MAKTNTPRNRQTTTGDNHLSTPHQTYSRVRRTQRTDDHSGSESNLSCTQRVMNTQRRLRTRVDVHKHACVAKQRINTRPTRQQPHTS